MKFHHWVSLNGVLQNAVFFIRAVYRSKYLIILNTHKQRTDKRLIDVAMATEFAALNENRKSNFGTFKESDLQISG